MTTDLDAIKRRAERTCPGVDGVRPRHAGWTVAAYEDREALLEEVERLTDAQVAMWECRDCGFSFDACHEDAGGGYSCPHCGQIKAERERDELRATVERVEALIPDFGNSVHVADLLAVLHPQDTHSAASAPREVLDAPEATDDDSGAQGGVCGSEVVTLTRDDETITGLRWRIYPVDEPPVIRAAGETIYQELWEKRGWTVRESCGDLLDAWHGQIGPCVRTDRHDMHDDGAGVTWSRSVVPTPQEEA